MKENKANMYYSRKAICKFLKITPEHLWEIIEQNNIPIKTVRSKRVYIQKIYIYKILGHLDL